MMSSDGMMDKETFEEGRAKMMPFFGPDFGGEQDSSSEDDEDGNDGDDGGEGGQALSAEFVIDSSE